MEKPVKFALTMLPGAGQVFPQNTGDTTAVGLKHLSKSYDGALPSHKGENGSGCR
jgi:hypothetical protein